MVRRIGASVIAMYRLLMTNVLMLPFLWNHRKEFTRIKLRDWLRTVISGIALGLHFLFWMDSLRFTTVASSTAILTLEPIFVLVGAFLLYGVRTNRTALIAMCIAIVGAICIGWGDFQFSGEALKGDVLSFVGTIAVALHMYSLFPADGSEFAVMYVLIKQAYLGNLAPDHARSSYMALYGMLYRGATFQFSLGVILQRQILPLWKLIRLVWKALHKRCRLAPWP